MNTDRIEAVSERNSFRLEASRFVLAVLAAIATAGFVARGYFDNFDKRLSLVELQGAQLDNFDKRLSVVELQSAQQAQQVTEIHDDLRELRNAVVQQKR